jgi:phage anti-repressor protein
MRRFPDRWHWRPIAEGSDTGSSSAGRPLCVQALKAALTQDVTNRIARWSNIRMMTVYFLVMTICSGMEGCVEERKTGPTYTSRQLCIETAKEMAPRKGVKYKCRSERLWVSNEVKSPGSYDAVVSTKVKEQPTP